MATTASLLPSLGITGIGSLPHTQHELGLQMALQVDLPYLPQMPVGAPAELMIAAALEGLPGLRFDFDALCTVDLADWAAGSTAFEQRIETAMTSGELRSFEPTPEAYRAWRPFLWEVENRHLAFAKLQLSGPFTVRASTRAESGVPAAEISGLDAQIYRLLLARALAMVKAVRRAGATPVIFLDEPGLYALDMRDARHLLMLQELKVMVLVLQREGAIVGVHCCGNTRWDAMLQLPVQILSLDVRLSLDALLEEREAFRQFVARGSTLSLGIIPTNLSAEFEPDELVDSVEASLKATLGSGRAFAHALSRMLLTPACGLAFRSASDAEMLFQQVREAQRGLRALLARTLPLPGEQTLRA